MPKHPEPAADQVARALRDSASFSVAELIALGKRLREQRKYRLARQVLAAARDHPEATAAERLEAVHARVHATYVDTGLPATERLDRALAELDAADPLATTTNPETLGLAGAIHKRRWELYGRRQYLERSLGYYLRAHSAGVGRAGYAGIKAACVLDMLADAEEKDAAATGIESTTAPVRRARAREIRQELVDALAGAAETEDADWWTLSALMEAYVGLGDYDSARATAARAAKYDVPGWQRETMARQLVNVALLQERLPSAAALDASTLADVLRELLGTGYRGVQSAVIGKVGLALSGGGFRAALYHIGVLARLAELDMLRHVEVLSCVSGGSIVGAHYYLELRKLLQTRTDAEITRQDYIELVQRLERDFLAGVQDSLRVRIASNLWANLKMLFLPDYSRTHRAGDLIEKLLYSRVDDGEQNGPRWLDGLYIRPKGESPEFHPVYDNWSRSAKVPMLVLNATTLNTGHNWQFTASFMGEPPDTSGVEIESNYRLRRMYYEEAPPRFRRVRLGHAVAASACVPGLFEPLTLAGLYPGITVRLVDGGVHDNQGVASLLEQNCTVLLVSDASGQMGTVDRPGEGPLGVSLRSSSILGNRLREAQYLQLEGLRQAGLLRGLMFVHLKKGLVARTISWIGCEDETPEESAAPPPSGPLTPYGIHRDLQEYLARVRTDLDTFTDTEAHALMYAGYSMTKAEFARSVPGFPATAPPEQAHWRFLEIESALSRAEPESQFRRLLEVAGKRVFKVWRLSTPLKVFTAAAVLAVVAAILRFGWYRAPVFAFGLGGAGAADPTVVTLGGLLLTVLGVALGFTGARVGVKLIQYRKTLLQAAVGVGLVTFGFVAAWIHLWVFDWLFRRMGRRPQPSGAPAVAVGPGERVNAISFGVSADRRGQAIAIYIPSAGSEP